ncbi:MAG: hypothetical protein JWP94_19 [Mucilaginibacter sp.]|nr:hypothetical protein [Mucilaginibacter sp.]
MKNRDFFRLLTGVLVGLPFLLLMSNCNKDHSLLAQGQHNLAFEGRSRTLGPDYHVVWSSIPDSNTKRINRALSNASYGRVILDYNSSGWTSDTIFMKVPNQVLWIAGSGSIPGHLIAKTGGFRDTAAIFIKMRVAGCTINGYSNGVDSTQGRATIEMFKNSYVSTNGYTPSESRDAIHAGKDNATVEGVIVKNSGGDGVYLSGGHNVIVKDVIVDGANRNAISVIKGTNTAISNSVFKNTSGSTLTGTGRGPWAGMDIEPNLPTDTLNNITITNCVFSGNLGNNISIGMGKLHTGAAYANTIYFFYCTTAGGSNNGVLISSLKSDGPNTGEVYFQKCNFNYPAHSGIYVQNWCAGKMLVDFNKCTVYNAGASSNSSPPIFIGTSDTSRVSIPYIVGHVNFEGATNRIDDFNAAHPYIIGGGRASRAYDSITGLAANITIQKHYTNSNPILSFIANSGYTNTNITIAYTLVP